MEAKKPEFEMPKPLDSMQKILAIIFFVFSYGILFAIGSASSQIQNAVANVPILNLILPLPVVYDIPTNPIWNVSMMYLLMPIVGFWLVFLSIDWIQEFVETKHAKTIVFPIIFTVFCLAALYVAVYWMAAENAVLSGRGTVSFDFWTELRVSAFYLFLVSGLLGWVSRIAVEKIKI